VLAINPSKHVSDTAAIAKHRIGALLAIKDGESDGIVTTAERLR
jgi:hypothetical protein